MAGNMAPLILISVSSQRSSNGVFFYNALFDLLKINATYLGIRTTSLEGFRESFNFLGLHAASVAAPFKTSVLPLLDSLTESARSTGSVNSVRSLSGQLQGHNADLAGATALLSKTWSPGYTPSVQIYGAGGVVPSMVAAVRAVRPQAEIALHSRNALAGKQLCDKLHLRWKDTANSATADLWINATPASMTEPERLASDCSQAQAVFDLVATQPLSRFEATVRSRGQQFIRGFDFYRAQFAEQFRFYFDQNLELTIFDELAAQRMSSH